MQTNSEKPTILSARDARGGEIELRTRAQRTLFLAGLIGGLLVALGLTLVGLAH